LYVYTEYPCYVLYSEKDKKRYTGLTENITERLKEHNDGMVKSTSWRRPLRMVYYEWCEDMRDAVHREKYLKTYYGKHYIKNRIRHRIEQ